MDDRRPITPSDYEEFLRLFMRDQFRILAYISSLIHERAAAQDVFQETSLTLWRSFANFHQESEFLPWALGVARHQVLRHWRTRDRDRHIFQDSLLETLSTQAMELSSEIPNRQDALHECLQKLTERQQGLIQMFYGEHQSADAIAVKWNRTVHSVYKALKQVRRTLFQCVEARLAREAS